MNDEWISHEPDDPVWQGDLLLTRDPKTGFIRGIYAIITADCDIANRKFGRQLAGLRVMSLREYLRTEWAERKLRRTYDKETEKIREQIDKWNAQRVEGAGSLSAEVIVSWVKRCEPEQLCRDLHIPDTTVGKVRLTIARFRAALQSLDPVGLDDHMTRLVRFNAAVSGQVEDECRKVLLRQAQSDALPEDVFLLTDLPQVPEFGPAVVLLRELVGVPFGNVCFRTHDAVSQDHYLRIGRLHPVIKYALSQAFGVLYSRIGLPVTVENRRKAAIEQIATFQWD